MSNQENASARSKASEQNNKLRIRRRASVACVSCRDRRTRCVVPKGQKECTQCKKTGAECVIRNDDERRRPISKAYMLSLLDRTSMLEGMLIEHGVDVPPVAHPPKIRQDVKREGDLQCGMESTSPTLAVQKAGTRLACQVPSPPESATEDFPPAHEVESLRLSRKNLSMEKLDQSQQGTVCHLWSASGSMRNDHISGQLRFFGPTANLHVYSGSSVNSEAPEPPDQVHRAERIIRSLTAATYEYLMNLFWEHYNQVLLLFDRDTFEAARESHNPKFYSSFLHMTILAMAYRFADKDREDMIDIGLGSRESILHREAKFMLDTEFERPGGIPSVQALLILSDLECGFGRESTGWMYSGMANRLSFDIGLHHNWNNSGVTEVEVQIRRMVMRACVLLDRYWALFLGRPTSIKTHGVSSNILSPQPSYTSSANVVNSQAHQSQLFKRPLAVEINDQLLELMELAGRIADIQNHKNLNSSSSQSHFVAENEAKDATYSQLADLDREFQNWYHRLPEHLAWKPLNTKGAPSSFFLLHQQFHVVMILLHRSWVKYTSITGDGLNANSHTSSQNFTRSPEPKFQHQTSTRVHTLGTGDTIAIGHDFCTKLSRRICTQQAIQVSNIFCQHRKQFNGKKMFTTGVQHAGTAAAALMAALTHPDDEFDSRSVLGHLEAITQAIEEMAETYDPAAQMYSLLKTSTMELGQRLTIPRAQLSPFGPSQIRHPVSGVQPSGVPTSAKCRAVNEVSTPVNLGLSHPSSMDTDPMTNPSPASVWVLTGTNQRNEPNAPHDFGFEISDWISGPADLNASIGICDDTDSKPEEFRKSPNTVVGVHSFSIGNNEPICKTERMDWRGSDVNHFDSVSLETLVSSVEKVAGAKKDSAIVAPRNRELDFLSL
ncbi:fungal-specific transcription factor domain-containing protein [Pseudomassariella vexata]|uniref:Fungal-specific transcription factor domain-domain-containing protein n=1 Tax=Pseudomassariella vexata TaxID=1141098 RepID=A0A1Y2EAG8_9PEZI|nr:fungal-specific transcription factor domain-containing protein [Pseudomassariella vexata]ORY68580.1 fungal-specific transcription factor domain-domain-containing protein [Pseudomassariella vexata]